MSDTSMDISEALELGKESQGILRASNTLPVNGALLSVLATEHQG
jgi:hypothetical protein